MNRFVICLLIGTGAIFAQTQLDRAWQLAANGQQAAAIKILNTLIETDPKNADARLLLGSLLVETGQRAESLSQLTSAVELRPKSAEAQNALGEAYLRFGRSEGDSKAARLAFERAVALNPNYGIAQSNLGQVLIATGNSSTAAEHLDRAIRLLGRTDDAADAYYLRAKIDASQGKAANAAKDLEQAVVRRPAFAEAWSELGQARKESLDEEGALKAFERAVQLKPDDAVAQYRLGAEYLHLQQLHEAVDHLQQAYRLNSQDQSTLNALQMALRQDHRPEEADRVKAELSELLRKKDDVNRNLLSAVRLNNEGAELERGGDYQKALEKYSDAVKLNPDHAGMHKNYGVALLRTGQWTEGLKQLHEALRLDPDSTEYRAILSDALKQAPPNLVPSWHEE